MHPTPTTTAASRPSLVASRLVELAGAAPDRPCISDGIEQFSAAAVHEMVGGLAAQLLDRSAPEESWLPIVVDRSARSAVALHAAIRAGRRLSPIEATLPCERIAELLGRLGHPDHAVVTDPAFADLLPAGFDVLTVPAPGEAVANVGAVAVNPDAPGCVIFTSGSTGRPKGVVKRWSAFENQMATSPTDLVRTPRRIGQLRPFSFGAGLHHLASMSLGHWVHVIDPSATDIETLIERLDAEQITSASFGTAIATTILSVTRGKRRLPALTTIRMAGQAAGWELVEPLRALASPEVSIVSGFGASEVGRVMQYSIGPDHPIGDGPLPLGRPDDPTRIRLEPIEPGSPTCQMLFSNPEALGYLDEPELTAERFVHDDDGVTWWRSGDIATVDERGSYYHQGRVDDMAKINGMLVEPAEAERAVCAVPGVANAAVLVHTRPSGAQRLIAHVQIDDPDLTPEAVRAELEATLPKHLVPAMLVRHDALPMNERSKIDRTVLRNTELVRWRSAPPRHTIDELELWMTDQVAGILDLGEVGPDDDIWHLGLDSLGAVELCAIIADAGFPDTAPTTLLQQRTPAAIAAGLSTVRPTQRHSSVVLNPDGNLPPLFVIPGGGGTSLAFRAVADLMPDQPIVVIEPRGMHQHGPVDRTLDGVVTNILNEIDLRLDPETPCTILGYSAGGTPAFEVARRRHEHRRSTHLVLLDTAPTRSRRTAPDPGDTQPAPTRTPAEFIARVRRGLHRRWLVLRPGPPSYSSIRYDAFRTIGSRANASYQPVVLDVPATLIHVAGNNTTERCAPWLPDLETHQVNGGHLSMLRPPHATELAHVLTSVINTTNHRCGVEPHLPA